MCLPRPQQADARGASVQWAGDSDRDPHFVLEKTLSEGTKAEASPAWTSGLTERKRRESGGNASPQRPLQGVVVLWRRTRRQEPLALALALALASPLLPSGGWLYRLARGRVLCLCLCLRGDGSQVVVRELEGLAQGGKDQVASNGHYATDAPYHEEGLVYGGVGQCGEDAGEEFEAAQVNPSAFIGRLSSGAEQLLTKGGW
mmetsp:Transcript_43536/g.70667  ORF Transcript_43536/g.70667 Transcript_43536/m.70667 type:complete len:202 (-) Transcript_43536:1043-1648(-)